jgi:hypothetical protein
MQPNNASSKWSVKEKLAIAAACLVVLWVLGSYVKDLFSNNNIANCKASQITKETKIRNQDGEVVDTKREVIVGEECDGVFIAKPDDR